MRTAEVVPKSKDPKILIGQALLRGGSGSKRFLEGAEEPLDTSVLPRSTSLGPLVSDSEPPEPEAEDRRRQHGFVVGTKAAGNAESLDDLQDFSQNRNGRLRPDPAQSDASSGCRGPRCRE